MVVRWLDRADERMTEIYNYYQQFSERTAKKIVRTIRKDVERLGQYHNMAPVDRFLDKFSSTYRALVTAGGRYKVIYFVDHDNNEVVIITVVNCRQDPQTAKDDVNQVQYNQP